MDGARRCEEERGGVRGSRGQKGGNGGKRGNGEGRTEMRNEQGVTMDSWRGGKMKAEGWGGRDEQGESYNEAGGRREE